MIYLTATDAVVAAGLHSHTQPRLVLDLVLSRLGLIAQPRQDSELPPEYTVMRLDRQALVREADSFNRKRRADPITARIQMLHTDIAAHEHLDAAAKDSLMDDTRGIYQRGFGRHQEQHTCKWFNTVHSKLCPASQQKLAYIQNGISLEKKQALRARMTVRRLFSEIGLEVQGLPDMRGLNSIVEVKNRLYAELDMNDKHRHADHAQLMVQLAVKAFSCDHKARYFNSKLVCFQVYLVLAEHDSTFQQPLTGYLVEHMRVGCGNLLRVEYRDIPYIADASSSVQASVEAAGHMVVTRYNVEQAVLYWTQVLTPALVNFCQLAERIIDVPEVLDSYIAAADKDLWFSEHI